MGYRTLGTFFTQHGFMTVIPNCRLVPEVKFPEASEDIRDAIVWVSQNMAAITAAMSMLAPDPASGAAHMMVMTMHEKLRGTVPPLHGLVLSGGPWFFGVDGEKFTTEGPVKFYFGSAEL
ncbi:hypothetical protein PAXRUDRAFT_796883 [Paxillus rubicundulus Ve08.2h10]|uniref:BD-FAE-like domain-containing protein n=1 Tax=Paxillus rubicundulus Ve08.2h10 TaxID=930991 RepID=A0A0D0D7H3_9AGAM|nr:hypothetical protein PAXRUDRAFT_796883 [Paxillus rubicundulus Ve08.2h10]